VGGNKLNIFTFTFAKTSANTEKNPSILFSVVLQVVYTRVVDLARIKLIFFIAADSTLCFRFVTKTLLITDQSSSFCCTVFAQRQGLLCFSAPQWIGWGLHNRLVGDTTRQMTCTSQRHISCHVTPCLVIKVKRGVFREFGHLFLRNWLGSSLFISAKAQRGDARQPAWLHQGQVVPDQPSGFL